MHSGLLLRYGEAPNLTMPPGSASTRAFEECDRVPQPTRIDLSKPESGFKLEPTGRK